MKTLNILALIILISACVPARKFEDVKADNRKLEQEVQSCKERSKELAEENETLLKRIEKIEDQLAFLKEDTAHYGQRYRKIQKLNESLNSLYEKVIQQNKDLLSTSSSENQRLNQELELKKRELEIKEWELNEKEKNINLLSENLKEREARVEELEELIAQKDKAARALREKMKEALLGFGKEELTVELKNGKVYVSLAEQLLFKSGSTAVNPKGREAIAKVAEVLKKSEDINILVEGHTDNVPLKGSGHMENNWDLSVLRATSVTDILISNGVAPDRVVAAGRGEHQPVASNATPQGRAQNRRTEIILTPQLDELMKMLEGE